MRGRTERERVAIITGHGGAPIQPAEAALIDILIIAVVPVWVVAFALAAERLAIERRRSRPAWWLFGAILGPIALALLWVAPPGTCPRCDAPIVGWPRACAKCGEPLQATTGDGPAQAAARSTSRTSATRPADGPRVAVATTTAEPVARTPVFRTVAQRNVDPRTADARAARAKAEGGRTRAASKAAGTPGTTGAAGSTGATGATGREASPRDQPRRASRLLGRNRADRSARERTARSSADAGTTAGASRAAGAKPVPAKSVPTKSVPTEPVSTEPAEPTVPEPMLIDASGIFVTGTNGLRPGSRYLLHVTASRMHVLGPVEIDPTAVAVGCGLRGLDVTGMNERLVISGTDDQRRNLILVFMNVTGGRLDALAETMAAAIGAAVDRA